MSAWTFGSTPFLIAGPCLVEEGDLLAYRREAGDQAFLVVLNLGGEDQVWPADSALGGQVRLSTHPGREGEAIGGTLTLRGDEGVIAEVGR